MWIFSVQIGSASWYAYVYIYMYVNSAELVGINNDGAKEWINDKKMLYNITKHLVITLQKECPSQVANS